MSKRTVLVLNDSQGAASPTAGAAARPGLAWWWGRPWRRWGAAPAEAQVLMVGAVGRPVVEAVWANAPRLEWVHNMWAGLEGLLFPGPGGESGGGDERARGVLALIGRVRHDRHALVRQRCAPHAAPSTASRSGRSSRCGSCTGRRWESWVMGPSGGRRPRWATSFGMRVCSIGRRHTREELARSARVRLCADRDAVDGGDARHDWRRGSCGLMKPTSVLINLGARSGGGGSGADPGLARGMDSRGRWLDVFDQEPLPAGHAFWELDNVLLSPHCADNTDHLVVGSDGAVPG